MLSSLVIILKKKKKKKNTQIRLNEEGFHISLSVYFRNNQIKKKIVPLRAMKTLKHS